MVVCSLEDYLPAFCGGLLIGLSATLNLITLGRITGLSGIFNSLYTLDIQGGFYWKYAFFAGLISSSLSLYYASDDGTFVNDEFSLTFFDKNGSNELHIVGWIIGGLLVGFGTKLGNGCTSGHGICGLPRFSIRSWVAVPTFMLFGIIMATIRYYSGFLESYQSFGGAYEDVWYWFSVALWAVIFIGFVIFTILRCLNAEKLF